MARVTVEDCVRIIPNRFKLCLIANNRAKSILSGANTTLDINEKPSVIALREIAEGLVNIDQIETNIIESVQNTSYIEDGNVSIEEKLIKETANHKENSPSKESIFLDDNLVVDD